MDRANPRRVCAGIIAAALAGLLTPAAAMAITDRGTRQLPTAAVIHYGSLFSEVVRPKDVLKAKRRTPRPFVKRKRLVEAPLELPSPDDGVVGRALRVSLPSKAYKIKVQLVVMPEEEDGDLIDAAGSYALGPGGKIIPTNDSSTAIVNLSYGVKVAKKKRRTRRRRVTVTAALKNESAEATGFEVPLSVALTYRLHRRHRR